MLTRNDAHHYFWNDRRTVGVNELCEGAGLVSYTPEEGAYLEIGRNIHLMCQFYLKDELDEASLDPFYAGFLKSLKTTIHHLRLEPIDIEEMLYSKLFGFAGQIDLRARFLDVDGVRKIGIFDWKSGVPFKHTPVLMAGYEILVRENFPDDPLDFVGSVQLMKDGRCGKLRPYHNPDAHEVFLAAVTRLKFIKGEIKL